MNPYDDPFFESIRDGSRRSAEQLVPLVIDCVHPASVVDVGAGLGTWLKVFERSGVCDYIGVDGDWVSRRLLEIEESRFIAADLTMPLQLSRRFDLVLCLEVAEHLPPESAETLVESLTRLGDVILFSAAVPGQGGDGHINCQWPDYWAKKFRRHGYQAADVFRDQIWNNELVDWWYRQNLLLYVRDSALFRFSSVDAVVSAGPQEPMVRLRPEYVSEVPPADDSSMWSRIRRLVGMLARLSSRTDVGPPCDGA